MQIINSSLIIMEMRKIKKMELKKLLKKRN